MNVHMMLVNCTTCHTPLQLPSGAKSIRCAICHAITHVADPCGLPPGPIPATPGPPPSPHGRKKAVICGISYRYSRHELKGCLNDAKCMKYLLINRFHFPESSIIMLTGI
ncbi:metacaspase-1-like protein [Cinnamomum micranthum f. kanehirae]|uniref:Metacaspase-1-like protein n=1 Tax=Cinnamomum micranthum f. kanehirae TaxID=337451 RepID=A0A3S3QMI7_9MAGN|nr:metacaspase-1-like protein [Cinnamomum micranthum f. kanehirae]RWR86753.1 metacaspase-1-like protein [Cinnamomum micranthum f. kanehirae]